MSKKYSSDTKESEWKIIEEIINKRKALQGRPPPKDARRLWDGIFYITKNGCLWRDLPKDFGYWKHSMGCLLTIIKPDKGTKGFNVQQWRWVVERSFAWLGNFRRLSKDYEMTVSSSKAFIALAFTKIMMKHLC